MDFTPDETLRDVAELAASVLRAEPDHSRTTTALASPLGYDETAWKAMAQAGLLSLAIPTEHGGDGLGAVEVAAVLTEVGRQTLPVPALATLALGVLPVAALGTPTQQSVLADVAHGAVLTAALRPMSAVRAGDDLVISGSASGVPFAAQATRILVPTDLGIALVAPDADGVTLARGTTSTGTPEYTLSCTAVRVGGADVLAGTAGDLERFAVAGAAALADGVGAGALALTAAHLRERRQFGKPLATFQAVAQQIADVYVTTRAVHLAALSANWRLATGRDADDDLDIAAYWLAAELVPALQACHHLHGGLGVDITYPLHRYYAQAKDLARFVGGASLRLDRIGVRCSSN